MEQRRETTTGGAASDERCTINDHRVPSNVAHSSEGGSSDGHTARNWLLVRQHNEARVERTAAQRMRPLEINQSEETSCEIKRKERGKEEEGKRRSGRGVEEDVQEREAE